MPVGKGEGSGVPMIDGREILRQRQGIGIDAFKYVKETVIQRSGVFIQKNKGIRRTQIVGEVGCFSEELEGVIHTSSGVLFISGRAHVTIGGAGAVPRLVGCGIQIRICGTAVNTGIASSNPDARIDLLKTTGLSRARPLRDSANFW